MYACHMPCSSSAHRTHFLRAGPAPGIPVIPGIPAMTDLPGESGMPGIPLLTGITDKQNQNERLFSLLSSIIDHCMRHDI